MTDQAGLLFVGTGYFSDFLFYRQALHTNVFVMFSLCFHLYFPLSKNHTSFRQNSEGSNTWQNTLLRTMYRAVRETNNPRNFSYPKLLRRTRSIESWKLGPWQGNGYGFIGPREKSCKATCGDL